MTDNCENPKSDSTVLLGQVEIPVSPVISISHAEHLLIGPFSIDMHWLHTIKSFIVSSLFI